MRLSSSLFLFFNILLCYASTRLDLDSHDYYVLEHNSSGGATLPECTHGLGVELVRQVGELENHWVVRVQKPSVQRREAADPVLERLHVLRSSAVSGFNRRTPETANAYRVTNSIRMLEKQELKPRFKRDSSLLERQAEDGPVSASRAVAKRLGIRDPIFSQQWHIVNDQDPKHMMNVTGVWEMGITGEGVISAMVDDGLDFESDDLAANFNAAGSYDFNLHVPLPKPMSWEDRHGTRCAGEIAAVRNDVCGVGLAYNSKIAGIRILGSGGITDVDESSALNYAFQNTSIYSCSWGPHDDGRTMEGPSLLIQKAFLNGINKGRGGKGSVYVFASGNGAASGDQCNFDGYTNSIYSVTVAAIDIKGLHPAYSEACAANMVVTYSSGGGEFIHTTDVGKDKCSDTHGGTSAAAPLAAGVIALALSARPELTWRDIQHLCVQNAVKINPNDPDWERTAIGRDFSYKYGYGLLDAGRYVEGAKAWKLVKPQAWAQTDVIEFADAATNETTGKMMGGEMIVKGGVRSSRTITESYLKESNLEKVEHITVRVWITHQKRGDVEVELISPTGVKSILAARRQFDAAITGYPGWTFMTIKHWGESGIGEWTLRVSDLNHNSSTGHFLGWSMTLWGESIDPTKAKLFELPDKIAPLPPHQTISSSVEAGATKSFARPTQGLPTDHATAEGENSKPAFPPQDHSNASMPSTSPESFVTGVTSLFQRNTGLFVGLGILTLLTVGFGIFLCRRESARRRRLGADYSAVPGEATAMTSLGRGNLHSGRSTEAFDTFGVGEDDEDDEQTGLVHHDAAGEDHERYRDQPH